MKTLEKNAVNVWGDKGKAWLSRLPGIIEAISLNWNLSDIMLVDNMTYNYVAKAIWDSATPVVLKISCDPNLIESEYLALTSFNGKGAIQVLKKSDELSALLLQQAIPGESLKCVNYQQAITHYSQVINQLSLVSVPDRSWPHVRGWCDAIDRVTDPRIKKEWLEEASYLKDYLLSTAKNEYLCHGDLHLGNIIKQGDDWLAIDPKGIIGEMAFEVAAFDLIRQEDRVEPELMEEKIKTRIGLLADALELDRDRLLFWFFLRVMIKSQWFIEDNGDPDHMLVILAAIYPLISDRAVARG
jgi:streptomycin 6-kinase